MKTNENKEYLGWLSNLIKAIVFLGIYFLFALVVMLFFNTWPKTGLGWLVGLTLGPIAYVLFEGSVRLVHKGINKIPIVMKARQEVQDRNEGKTVSSDRIGYVLIEMMVITAVLMGIGFGVYKLLGDTFDPIISFFKENYG